VEFPCDGDGDPPHRFAVPPSTGGELPSMIFPFFMKEGVAPSGDGVIVPETYDW